ncbi:MAG TPA: ferredoxin--NADP reductase [Chryseolinea sp.]
MKLNVLRITNAAADAVSLYFERTQELENFKAGQHGLFSFLIDGNRYTRSYSFHTAPGDSEIGITVRTVNNGVVSNYLRTAKSGEMIDLEAVSGDFFVEPVEEIKRHMVMFAGGSGITPIFSMIKAILYGEPRSKISLIYSNKDHESIIFANELNTLQELFPNRLKVYHVITRQKDGAAGFPVYYQGRLSKLVTRKILQSIQSEMSYCTEYYLCGPYAFMQMIDAAIQSLNTDRTKIHKEHFFVPDSDESSLNLSNLPTREIIIQNEYEDRLLIVDGGKSILQAANENNFKLRFSCAEGKCGTCRASLVSGQVTHRRNHILSEDELKAGQVLLCQGYPTSWGVTIKVRQ